MSDIDELETDENTIGIETDTDELADALTTKRASVLDGLREFAAKKQEEKRQPRFRDVNLPGWEGRVVLRFRILRMKEIERQSKILRSDKSRQPQALLAALDTVRLSCAGVAVRDDAEAEPIPLDEMNPVKFEDRLTDALGWPRQRTARDIIKALFPSEQSVIALGMELNRWMTNPEHDIDEELLGE